MDPAPLVLASTSPRRRHLLADYGFRAEVMPAPVEESSAPWLTVPELVLLNARRKSASRWREYPEAAILGVDTLVCLDDRALGKPANLSAAFAMLTQLSGRTHQVYSGVCVARPVENLLALLVVRTDVTFLPLDAGQIREYLTLIDPLDKAGSYAAQEHGERIIASVEGSWTNVLGLPMETLQWALEEHFGIRPSSPKPSAA